MSWSPIGRPIRVGAFEHDPDAFNCFRRMPRKECEKPGAEIEIISMVMKLLDWQWEMDDPPEWRGLFEATHHLRKATLLVKFCLEKYKHPVTVSSIQWEKIDTEARYNVVNDFGNLQPDGNFSGIMGLLAKDTIDMSGLSMRITPERMQFAHFTFPIRYFQQVYIIKRPPENDFRNFVFAPFSTEMWILLLATVMVVSTVRFLCALYWDSRVGSKSNIYTSSVLETFAIMFNQRVPDPSAFSTMVLEGILMFTMLSVTQYYQTIMNSLLTAPPSSRIPFFHQNQLAEQLVRKQTYLTYYFNYSLEGSSVKNEKMIEEAMKYNPIVVRSHESDLIKEIQRGGVFYSTYDVEFLPYAVSTWDKREGLTVIRDTTGIISYVAFGFSVNNRKLCQMFNKMLLKILPGVPSITRGPGYGFKKQPEDITVQVRKTELSLRRHLEELFYIYLIGMGLSICLFVVEVLYFRLAAIKKIKVYQVNKAESDRSIQFTPLPYD